MLVYEFKKHDITVTFTRREDREPIVLFALGSELRAFKLGEFTDFWLSMIEEARKAQSEYLRSSAGNVQREAREKT